MKQALIELFFEEIPSADLERFDALLRDPVKKAVEREFRVQDVAYSLTPQRVVFGFSYDTAAAKKLPGVPSFLLSHLKPKYAMTWDASGLRAARPIRNILFLADNKPVAPSLKTVPSRAITFLPRYQEGKPTNAKNPGQYFETLKKAQVILDHTERRRLIREELERAAARQGVEAIIPEALLTEVTFLVEAVNVQAGEFSEKYLALPAELIERTAEKNQRYFLARRKNGKLANMFFFAANGFYKNISEVITGNETVLTARLEDAFFYFTRDAVVPLSQRREQLKDIPFHPKLGSVYDKAERMERVARVLGAELQVSKEQQKLLQEAVALAKLDYATELGREFPELLGIVGGYYAAQEGVPAGVSEAMKEQYLPDGGAMPETELGTYLSLVDKLDTIFGFASKGIRATAEEDPYGLRRAALGIIRMMTERRLAIDTERLLKKLNDLYETHDANVDAFIKERFANFLIESGVQAQVAQAVSQKRLVNFSFEKQMAAVLGKNELDFFIPAAKRVCNILRGQTIVKAPLPNPDPNEKQLLVAIEQLSEIPAVENAADIAQRFAPPAGAVEAFFTNVLVMDEDLKVRKRRLYLLSLLRDAILKLFNPEVLLSGKRK